MKEVLFSRSRGFVRETFYEQECVRLIRSTKTSSGILLDIQVGKALVLVCDREPGDNGIIHIPIGCIRKQYD